MQLSTFIARRIAFNSQRSFSRFIIRLAAGATAISVAAMILTLAFVNGFQQTISNKIFNFWGHIRVQHYSEGEAVIAEEIPLQSNDTVERILHNIPQVKQVQVFATKSAIVEKNKEINAILFKGVDSHYDYNNLKSFMLSGGWLNFKDSLYSKDIMLSLPVATELNIKVNDSVNVYFILQDKQKATVRHLKVCGIYKTGMDEYDKLFAIGDIRLLRRVYNWQANEIGGYEVFVKDYKQLDTINRQMYQMLPLDWISRTVKDIYPNIFDWLQIQDINRDIIFIVMGIIAIINLITCLLILILERAQMVGVLKALGSDDLTIQKIFLYHALYITGTGILIGVIAGVGICLLQQHTGFITMNESAYYVSTAPVDLIWWQVLLVCAGTLLVCLLALLIPTLLVKKVRPVKAIQFR